MTLKCSNVALLPVPFPRDGLRLGFALGTELGCRGVAEEDGDEGNGDVDDHGLGEGAAGLALSAHPASRQRSATSAINTTWDCLARPPGPDQDDLTPRHYLQPPLVAFDSRSRQVPRDLLGLNPGGRANYPRLQF